MKVPPKPAKAEGKTKPTKQSIQQIPLPQTSALNLEQLASEPIDAKYASRKIIYNWKEDKKDLSSDEENLQDSAPDFEKLLKMAPSIGSHFVFKSEKKWENENVESLSNKYSKKYFNLDPNMLNLSLLSIPFYERHDFEFFDDEEKSKMDKQAKNHEENYWNALEKFKNDNLKLKTNEKPVKSDIVEQVAKLEIKAPKKPIAPSKGSEDIQQWLDDILDI